MQRERQNKQNKPDEEKKEGYIIVTNYFLKKWVKVLGVGPVVLYEELLTYCHKGKYIAWPTINSLCQQMGIAKTTLLRYQDTLIKFGLIKNITRGKSTTGHYRNNIYQITPLEELKEPPDPGKIIDFLGSKMKPDRYQNDIGSNMKLSLVSNRYPNNTNLNNTKATTTKGEKDAVAAANFKKLKEEGEERMHAVREQLRDLDIEGKFIEQLLKDYPPSKIEEKLDLLIERRNIKRPAGWLNAALKNDYQGAEQEKYDEEPVEQISRQTPLSQLNSRPSMGKKSKETIVIDSHLSPEERKIQSRERVLKMIKKTRKMLANLKTKGGTNVRAKISN